MGGGGIDQLRLKEYYPNAFNLPFFEDAITMEALERYRQENNLDESFINVSLNLTKQQYIGD